MDSETLAQLNQVRNFPTLLLHRPHSLMLTNAAPCRSFAVAALLPMLTNRIDAGPECPSCPVRTQVHGPSNSSTAT